MPPKKTKKLVSEETKAKNKNTKKPVQKKISREKTEDDEIDEDTPLSDTEYIGGDSGADELDAQEDVENITEVEEQYENIDEDDILDGEGKEIDNEDEDEQVEEQDEMDIEEKGEDGDQDDCIYRFTKKKSEYVADEDVDEEYFSEEEAFIPENEIYVPDSQRITKPVMTKYERVRIIGDRTKQLSLGAKPMIKGVENMDPKEVAKLELKKKVMPLIIIRPLPSGKKEKWRVSELEIVN
jgi:DNA-directed RNA polymerase subunit K/omega